MMTYLVEIALQQEEKRVRRYPVHRFVARKQEPNSMNSYVYTPGFARKKTWAGRCLLRFSSSLETHEELCEAVPSLYGRVGGQMLKAGESFCT